MADRSAEGDHGGDTGVQPLVTLSEAVHNANEAGRDIEAAHASQIEKAVSSLERSSIVPLSQEDRTIVWMHCFTLWNCCVRLRSEHSRSDTITARLRHASARLAAVRGDPPARVNAGDELRKPLEFFFKAAFEWQSLGKLEQAEVALSSTDSFSDRIEARIENGETFDTDQDINDLLLICSTSLERAGVNWTLRQTTIVINLLQRCIRLLSRLAFLDDNKHTYALQMFLRKSYEIGKEALTNSDAQVAVDVLETAVDVAEQIDNKIGTSYFLQVLRAFGIALSEGAKNEQMMNTANRILFQSPWDEVGCLLLVKSQAFHKNFEEMHASITSLCKHDMPNDIKLDAVKEALESSRFNIAFEALTLLVQQADFDKKHELIINVVNSTLSGQKDNEKLLDALLETLSQENVEAAIRAEGNSGERSCAKHLCNILWNAGAVLYKNASFHLARKLMEACLHFLPSDDVANRSTAARVVALCAYKVGNFEDAYDFTELALQVASNDDPSRASITWLKIKVLLRLGQCNSDSILELQKSLGFSEDHMYLVIREAYAQSNFEIAETASISLIDFKLDQREECPSIQLLCAMVQLSNERHTREDVELACVPASIFDRVLRSLENFTYDDLNADSTEESVEESLEWIAAMAWNAAIKSAKASRYEEAAKNFRAAARIPRFKRWQSTVQSVNLCLLLSASAFLLSLENGDHHTNSMENMLQRTEQTLADVDLHEEPESAKLKEFADMLAFELDVRRSRKGNVTRKIKDMESMQPKTKAEFQKSGEAAIRMASICERNQSLYDLSQRLYKVAMEHLSAAHGTDKDDSAQELYLLPHAVRRQLVLAPEEVKNQSIKDTKAHLMQHVSTWPKEEAAFVIATSWNHGAMLAKLGRYNDAAVALDAAMAMLQATSEAQSKCVSLFQHERNDMYVALQTIKQKCSSNSSAGSNVALGSG